MPERTDHPAPEPTLVAAYADATQACRDIAARVGVRECDDDADWKAAEWRADDLHTRALLAGHSVEELSAASEARKAQR